ncbi:MAG: hypothetical protein AAB263_14325, partial [Planctomycetota bacterium]
ASGIYVDYKPTWAALSRLFEHRLIFVRMSLFGTPALDLNGDGIVDATTVSGAGIVTVGDPQLHFSVTGRWNIGQCNKWRLFIRSELWDRRNDKLATEASLERVIAVDPAGDGSMTGAHSIFSRWHGNPIVDPRMGPTTQGRTEAFTSP